MKNISYALKKLHKLWREIQEGKASDKTSLKEMRVLNSYLRKNKNNTIAQQKKANEILLKKNDNTHDK